MATAMAGEPGREVVVQPAVVAAILGMGGEWDPGFWQPFNIEAGVTEADWQRVTERVRWMRPGFVRMMMQTKWCYRDGAAYDFETVEMKSLYRHLDVCQAAGIAVVLSDWGCEPQWLQVPGIAGVGDPKYAAAIGGYMEHLVKVKKYSCIQYFVMVNEPNLEVKDWERWKQGFTQVAAELKKRGLDKQVVMTGTDESGNEKWHRQGVEQLSAVIGLYDLHRYTALEELTSGKLQAVLAAEWAYARQGGDSAAAARRCIVGEAGLFAPGFSAGNNALADAPEYGVYMADYAVQALNAGSNGVSAWMFDDSSHKDFTWGMWRNKAGQFELKPWFYTWALICRTVRPGAAIHPLQTGVEGLRGFAAKLGADGAASGGNSGAAWTVCLVNRTDKEQATTVKLAGAAGGSSAVAAETFAVYVYTPTEHAADANGFPVPALHRTGRIETGLNLTAPAHGVVVATTAPAR